MMQNWYVLHVRTGTELEVRRQLQRHEVTAVVPEEYVLIRRGGKWHEESHILMPGYVFVFMEYSAYMFHIIKSVSGAIRLLPKDKPMPLLPDECPWLMLTLSDRDVLPVSRVDFNGEEPIVVDGPLEGLRDYITKWERRRRKATLRIPMHGNYHEITLSFLPV